MLLAKVGNKARISPLNVNWLDLLVGATSNLSLTYYIHMYILTWHQWCEKQVWMLWSDSTQKTHKDLPQLLSQHTSACQSWTGWETPMLFDIPPSPPPPPMQTAYWILFPSTQLSPMTICCCYTVKSNWHFNFENWAWIHVTRGGPCLQRNNLYGCA